MRLILSTWCGWRRSSRKRIACFQGERDLYCEVECVIRFILLCSAPIYSVTSGLCVYVRFTVTSQVIRHVNKKDVLLYSDFSTEPELMPKTPSQKKTNRRKRVSMDLNESRSKRR